MSSLRIFVPSAEGSRMQWARFDDDQRIIAEGGESQLVASDKDDAIELIVPAERVLLIPATISAEQRDRLSDDKLSWLAEPYLVQEIETVHVVRGRLSEDGRLPLCAVEHAWLSAIIARLAVKQIQPARIVPEIFLSEWQEGHWVLVLKSAGGFVRTGLAQGFILDRFDDHLPSAVLMLALRNAVTPEEILVYCEEGVRSPDCRHWADLLGVPVRYQGLWQWSAPIPDASIDLARGAYSAPSGGRKLLSRLKPTLWLVAGILALNLGAMLTITALGVLEKGRLNAQIEAQLRSAFPQTTVILDPMLQMRQNLERLSRNAGLPTRGDFLPMLGAIGATLGKEASGRVESLSYEAGSLSLELSLPDQALLAKLKNETVKAGLRTHWEELPANGNSLRVRLRVSS